VETQNLLYIMKSSRGFRHHDAFSRRSFIQYKESLEKLVALREMKELINLSSGGIIMEGVPNVGSGEFFSRYCHEPLPKPELKRALLSSSPVIGSTVPTAEIRDILMDKETVARVLEASLGVGPGDAVFQRTGEKILSFLSRGFGMELQL
jgi:hypothetical protein